MQLTMDYSCKELCRCIFVRQPDNKRCGCLQEQQHTAFLMGDNKCTEKMVEAKTLLKNWKGPSSAQLALIANKEEEGGVALSKKGKTAAVKKSPKGKCQGCGMVNNHFLSDCKVVSKNQRR